MGLMVLAWCGFTAILNAPGQPSSLVYSLCNLGLFAATINGDGLLRCRATGVGSHTLLAGIIRLVEQAQGSTDVPVRVAATETSSRSTSGTSLEGPINGSETSP